MTLEQQYTLIDLKCGLKYICDMAEVFKWERFDLDKALSLQAMAEKLYAEAKAEREAEYEAAKNALLSAGMKAVA